MVLFLYNSREELEIEQKKTSEEQKIQVAKTLAKAEAARSAKGKEEKERLIAEIIETLVKAAKEHDLLTASWAKYILSKR